MVLPIRPNNPNIPIPNTTFSSDLNVYVNGPYFPVVMGTGIDVGTGTKVADLNNQGVLEFSGATGDINLLAGTGISVVETTSGNNSDFTISNTGVTSLVAGSNITLSASSGTVTISASSPTSGTVTSVGTGVGLTGGPITSSGTISLDVSGVTPGSYTYPSITVDAYGRITVAANGTVPVTAITGTAPVQVTGSAPTLNVAVAASSTTAPGVVQLVDALNSTSTTQALTAAQGKVLQDQITALSAASNLTFAGTIDGSTGFMVSVSTEAAGLTTPFVVGQAMPAAASENEDYFTIVSVAGTMTPPGGSSTATTVGDWFLSTGSSYQFLDTGFNPPYASTTEAGIVELADNAETQAGTDATLAVTPAGLQSKVSDSVSTASSTSIASSQAVKDAYDAATAAGADVGNLSTLTTTDKSSAVAAINEVDANADQALTDAAAAQATADAAIPCAALLAKGDLIGASSAGTPVALPVGSNGQILYACSACTSGLRWGAAPVVPDATPDVSGKVLGYTCLGFDPSFNLISTTALGCGALAAGLGLSGNVAIGSCAMAVLGTGCNNTAIGDQAAGAQFTNGCWNTVLGRGAGWYLSNTSCNVLLGSMAGCGISTGASNLVIGTSSGLCISSGSCNVVIGNGVSFPSNTSCCLAIGYGTTRWLLGASDGSIKPGAGIIDCAGSCGTAGQILSSNGSNAIEWIAAPSGASVATPLLSGTVLGCTTGFNTSLGCSAMECLASGFGLGNVAIGNCALRNSTSGNLNIAIGRDAMLCGNGGCNIAVGDGTLAVNAAGTGNVAIGCSAYGAGTTGSFNTVVGYQAGCNTTGNQNVAIGCNTRLPNPAGCSQLAIGFSATDNWITGDSTKAIKPGAGIIDCAGSCGTAGQVLMSNGANAICWGTAGGGGGASPATPIVAGIVFGCTASTTAALGCQALAALTTGLCNTAIGFRSMCKVTTATNNTAVGTNTLTCLISGSANVAVGCGAGRFLTGDLNTAVGNRSMEYMDAGLCNTALGFSAMLGYQFGTLTGCCNVALGIQSLQQMDTGNCNVAVGPQALQCTGDGSLNVAIGSQAGRLITTGSSNVVIGPGQGVASNTGSCQLAIGWGTGCWLTGCSTGAIQPAAGIIDCTGSCGTAGQVLSSNGSNAIEWITAGGGGGSPATPTAEGTLFGYSDGATNFNVGLGYDALNTTSTGLANLALGYSSGCAITSGVGNVLSGAAAGCAITTGSYNVGSGFQALSAVTTGQGNIAIGNLSGNAITTEDYNVVIGGNPGPTGVNNNILLADGQGTLRMQVNESGAMSPNGIDYGTAGQVLTSNGSGTNWTWETPSGGDSPVVTYNQLINVTSGTAASVIGWETERGTSENYLLSGNVSAMLFITANNGTNGTTPRAWAQILISSLGGVGLSQVIASDTTGGTFSIAAVIYPAYTDTTVQFTSNTTDSPMLFNISLNWFGGFRYVPTLYGTAAT